MSGVIHAVDDHLIAAVAKGQSGDPFAVLGRHAVTGDHRPAVILRTMQPGASAVEVLTSGRVTPMARRHPHGLFEARIPLTGAAHDLAYTFRVHEDGAAREIVDPYQYGQVLSDDDLHLFSEGTYQRAWETLGSHVMTIGGLTGVHFAVWAPNAQRVSVVGDFNRWDGRVHPMRRLVPSGVWELFVPQLTTGACYKFEVRTDAGHLLEKADPYARHFEVPPRSASVIWEDGGFAWSDDDWMRARHAAGGWHDRPMSIYEVHLGSWRRVHDEDNRYLTYRELAETLVPYVREMGYTHIELLPVMEHPFSGSWGYQVLGFFARPAGSARRTISGISWMRVTAAASG